MMKLVISRAVEQSTATQKKAEQALKEKEKETQEIEEFVERFRTLRVANLLLRHDQEAADKEAAGQADTKKTVRQEREILTLATNG